VKTVLKLCENAVKIEFFQEKKTANMFTVFLF